MANLDPTKAAFHSSTSCNAFPLAIERCCFAVGGGKSGFGGSWGCNTPSAQISLKSVAFLLSFSDTDVLTPEGNILYEQVRYIIACSWSSLLKHSTTCVMQVTSAFLLYSYCSCFRLETTLEETGNPPLN